MGASSCAGAASSYRSYINQRRNETGGVSPVEIVGSYLPGTDDVQVEATFRLVDPASLVNLRATLLLYEDNVFWCCGFGGVDTWQHVTRRIYDRSITLTNVGDQVLVSTTFPIGTGWNPEELHAVAYLQQTSGDKQIIQGALLPMVLDFTFVYDNLVRSVPNGNGIARFQATLTNIGQATDTFTIDLGDPFGGWARQFYVCGDYNPHTTPVQVILDPNESCIVKFEVTTDATKVVRQGSLHVSSATSGRMANTPVRVFNGSYSVLLVDNDGSNAFELPLVNALNALGYLYDNRDVNVDGFPKPMNMSGFDMIIWHTARNQSTLLGSDETDDLMAYMDNGGALFLTSNYYLNSLVGVANTFVTNYLGVASWTLDKGYDHLYGVAGDVIGDGLDLPLSFQFPSFKRGDDAVPGPTATTDLLANEGSHAMIRNQMPSDGPKAVFMPERFDAVSETDPDPNNARVLLQRVLDWLKPPSAADVGDLAGSILTTRIAGVRPNPFNPRTEIAFVLSSVGAAGPVRLEVFDLDGRKVAGLFEGALTPGMHVRTWTGLSDDGRQVQSGVYFVRLTTLEGSRSQKMVLLK